MNPLQCDNIKEFVEKVDQIVEADQVEWQGKKVTFGDPENISNLKDFLASNAKFWADSQNPAVGARLLALSGRIKKEAPEAQELANQCEKHALMANLPREVIQQILGNMAEGYRWGREIRRDFHATKMVSKEWASLTENAKRDYLNTHTIGWDQLFKTPAQLIKYAVQCGESLKVFNGFTFFDRYSFPAPFSHDDYLQIFAACPNLTEVVLAGGGGVIDATLQALCEKCPKLTALSLHETPVTKLPDQLPLNLEKLQLVNCGFLKTFPSALPPKLETLQLYNTSANLAQLPAGLRNLEVYMANVRLPEKLPETLTNVTFLLTRYMDDRVERLAAAKTQLQDYQKRHPGCQTQIQ